MPNTFVECRQLFFTLLLLLAPAYATAQVQVDSDGTVHMPAQAVPVSEYLGPEGRSYLVEHLLGLMNAGAAPTGAAFGGDAGYYTMPLGEGRVMAPPGSTPTGIGGGPDGYFSEVALDNPLVAPTTDADILSRFPPTLVLSDTRSYDLSNAVHTHMQLVRQDVTAELYVWEGMFHGFFYNAEVPESREAFAVITDFFARRLGRE